jgi:hypothetical protein
MACHSEEIWESVDVLWRRIEELSRQVRELEARIGVVESAGQAHEVIANSTCANVI